MYRIVVACVAILVTLVAPGCHTVVVLIAHSVILSREYLIEKS